MDEMTPRNPLATLDARDLRAAILRRLAAASAGVRPSALASALGAPIADVHAALRALRAEGLADTVIPGGLRWEARFRGVAAVRLADAEAAR